MNRTSMPEPAAPVLLDPDGRFAAHYNCTGFAFRHRLAGHPLFELDSLVDLSRRLPAHADFAYWSNGSVDVGDRWDGRGTRESLQATIADIAGNDSLVILKHVDQDPVIGPLLQRLLAGAVWLSGSRMADDVILGRATILIASPHRVTSYHMDADTNFLLQLSGSKDLRVFDQTDRSLLPEQELERFHAGDANGAVFKPARQRDGEVFDLHAGDGVHIPCTAPHWARNRDQVSVALSLNYDLRSMARTTRIYRLNHRLRRLGLQPIPPGVSRWRDGVKLASQYSLEAIRTVLQSEPRPAVVPAWTPQQALTPVAEPP